MTIAVQHNGTKDKEQAEKVVEYINNNTKYSAFEFTGSNISFSEFEGVLVIGGSDANELYDRFARNHGWQRLICGNEYGFGREGVATKFTVYKGAVVEGLAGCTEEDTADVVDWWLGNTNASWDAFDLYGAGIDDFIERINDQQAEDGDGEEVEDPTDPVLDPGDPDEPEPVETPHTLQVSVPPSFSIITIADYTIEVSGIGEAKSELESTEGALGSSVYGKVGESTKVDNDIFDFSGKIVSIDCGEDLFLVINGEEYFYDAKLEEVNVARGPADLPMHDMSEASLIKDSLKSESFKKAEQGKEDDKEKTLLDRFFNTLGLESQFDRTLFVIALAGLLYIYFAQSSRSIDINLDSSRGGGGGES